MKKLRFVEGSRGGEPFAELQRAQDKWDASHMVELGDLFPAGPDGRRHPTDKDLYWLRCTILGTAGEPTTAARIGHLLRLVDDLATVAPKEE